MNETEGPQGKLVAWGKRIDGVKLVEVDAVHFDSLCFSEDTVNQIQSHFDGLIELDDAELLTYCAHVKRCSTCARKVEAIRSVCEAGLSMVLDQESLHTSVPPSGRNKIVSVKTELSPSLVYA